jgi:RimJ/RimL family protein N-acetyltransferase
MLVADEESGAIFGSSSFMDIQPRHRTCEVGCTWFAERCRGTHVNPECKLLMLTHVFDALFGQQGPNSGCIRVTLKCDVRNARSRREIEKLGAQPEGVLRNHRVLSNGQPRDTASYSVLPDEWPGVRAGLETRLRVQRGRHGTA